MRRGNMCAGIISDLLAIEFTDSSFMRFVVHEEKDGGEYGIEAVYPGRNPVI